MLGRAQWWASRPRATVTWDGFAQKKGYPSDARILPQRDLWHSQQFQRRCPGASVPEKTLTHFVGVGDPMP